MHACTFSCTRLSTTLEPCNLVKQWAVAANNYLVAGDFNSYFDDKGSYQSLKLYETFYLNQPFNFLTHELGHTSDLVFTKLSSTSQDRIICIVKAKALIVADSISDHLSTML